jgi:acetylornithine deacetylase/succinyl-diaminopimelate desuccinylase-like protein
MQNRTFPLLQQLCSIPSWVDKKKPSEINERAYADFVYSFLKEHCPYFTTIQRVGLKERPERHSIFAKTDGPLQLLFAVHLDTVWPSTIPDSKPTINNFEVPQQEGKRYYHLGAADTKGGACALLTAAAAVANVPGIGLLFYTDEEYDFSGMIEIVQNPILTEHPPKKAIVIEPSDLKIQNEHRGLIEFKYRIFGESGHAGRDHEGLSASRACAHAYVALEEYVRQADDERLRRNPQQRRTAMNLGYLVSGQQPKQALLELNQLESTEVLQVGIEPNKKPDVAQMVFDIRPGDPNATSVFFTNYLDAVCRRFHCRGEVVSVKHEHGALSTDLAHFNDLQEAIQKAGITPETKTMHGYGDGQILAHALKIPVCYLGPTGGNLHNPREYVELDSVDTLATIYQNLMEQHE